MASTVVTGRLGKSGSGTAVFTVEHRVTAWTNRSQTLGTESLQFGSVRTRDSLQQNEFML